MDAVVAFIANGEATKPVEPGERALDDPAEHAKAAAVGRAATAEDRNNAAGGEAITMWLRIVATVALQDVGPSARPPAASANGGQVRVREQFGPARLQNARMAARGPLTTLPREKASTANSSRSNSSDPESTRDPCLIPV